MPRSTTLVQPRERGPGQRNLEALNPGQRMFVQQLLATEKFDPKEAAEKAGYKNPSQASHKLLNNKTVAQHLGAEIWKRGQRVQLTADDVLNHLRTILFLNPLKEIGTPGLDGKWTIKDLSQVPDHIGRCITKMKVKVKDNGDGTTTSEFEVEMMSKDAALQLAMKHLGLLSDKIDIKQQVDVSGFLADLVQRMEKESQVIDSHFIESKV